MSHELEENREPPNNSEEQAQILSRRRFLEIFSIGAGATLLLGPGQGETHAKVTPTLDPAAAGLAQAKEDPTTEDDYEGPVERTQYWRRRRRRYWRRRRRRYWRRRRRWYWRRRRRWYWRRRRRWWWRRRRRWWWRRRRRIYFY
jgi:hypothetical protein